MAIEKNILAFSGGVGGAKLSLGLSHVLADGCLSVVVNTGDDFTHLSLPISPDIDTTLYTLGDIVNPETGWGRKDESWESLEALKDLGQESWFLLGDKDLALHIARQNMIAEGRTLSEITTHFQNELGIRQHIIPMSDDPVRTIVSTPEGDLPFQHYFVKHRCKPSVTGFRFEGLADAKPSKAFIEKLDDIDLEGIVICPSNPFVSVDPILSLRSVRERLSSHPAPLIAVSPIVGGMAIKGPAAKMMKELNLPTSPLTVAEHYKGLLNGFVIDSQDASRAPEIEDKLQIPVHVCDTMMVDLNVKKSLATECLDFMARISAR